MNLKDRGITIGDLLILLIIFLTSTVLIRTFNKDKKTTLNHSRQDELSFNKPYYQNSLDQDIYSFKHSKLIF